MGRRLALLLVLAATALALPASALAAPPDNDDFAQAEVIGPGLPASVAGTNQEATKETGEDPHAGDDGGASVWYSWTPSADTLAKIETCASSMDTLLAVYTGTAVNDLSEEASSDDDCGSDFLQSRVLLEASGGTTYWIAVDGFGGEEGSFQLDLDEVIPPANDDFADAEPLTGAPATTTGTNLGATKEPDEPDHAGDSGGASVWYEWDAPSSGQFRVDACGSDFDTLVAVYIGATLATLDEIASNDQACFDQSRLAFNAVAGTTYRIAVDGYSEQGAFTPSMGEIDLRIRRLNPPANDNFANARNLGSGSTASAVGTNRDASKQAFEPFHGGDPGGASVWFRWTAPSNGTVDLDLCGSNFDTLLGVYRGSSLGSLIAVASNDEACGSRSAVTFGATAGTTYRIAVDGYSDFGFLPPDEGAVGLSLSHSPTSSPPAPDTEITKAPKKKTKKRTATFEFTSTKPDSTFECSLDGKGFQPCTSPHKLKKLKAKKGKGKKHGFEVRAIDSDGRVDQTPAEHAWKVKKKKKKRR